MTVLQGYSSEIVRDETRLATGAGGTPAGALVTSARADAQVWKQAIDQMLHWKSSPSLFEANDQPDDDILDTAVDYAVDQMDSEDGDPAPTSIIPSGSGRVAMEWNDGPVTVVIEFIKLGVATMTEFRRGKLVRRSRLVRNPRSRQLELRG